MTRSLDHEQIALPFVTVHVQHVECDEDRRRGDHRLVRVAKPLEPGPELVVEHRQLAVEDQRRGLELRECGRDVRVAAGVVDAVAAHEADAGAVLVGQHAVAVDLLLVDPTGAVKGRADERWGHRSVLADHCRYFTALSMRTRREVGGAGSMACALATTSLAHRSTSSPSRWRRRQRPVRWRTSRLAARLLDTREHYRRRRCSRAPSDARGHAPTCTTAVRSSSPGTGRLQPYLGRLLLFTLSITGAAWLGPSLRIPYTLIGVHRSSKNLEVRCIRTDS